MSSALALTGSTDTKWTVISGAMTGSVRLMTAQAFTLGRSPENDFVIVNDPKCSRKHAQVQWTAAGCEISALNEANPIVINGSETQHAVLNDGDVITLGETRIQFNLTTGSSVTAAPPGEFTGGHTHIALVEPTPPPPMGGGLQANPYAQAPIAHSGYGQPGVARGRPAARAPKAARKKQSQRGRVILYGSIALVVGIFLLPSAKKPDKLALRTEQQIEADIAEANKLQEKAAALPTKKYEENMTARQAQENYVRGFRDFRKGQYERALESFNTCLSLDPQHTLCNRYERLARRKFAELIQYDIILGRKYRDQNQFKNCRAAFRNVMVMVKDANDARYKESKANFDACNSMVEGRF